MPTEEETRQLVQAALDARAGAYVPYSKFRVGAALLVREGLRNEQTDATTRVVTGANVENASLGATICAERTAVVTAASKGLRTILAVAVAT